MIRLNILFVAGLTILLHNMIPHYHIKTSIGETETTFFIQNEILTKVLELIFKTDLGDGHLEVYDVEKNHIKKNLYFNDFNSYTCNNTIEDVVNFLTIRNETLGVFMPKAILQNKFNHCHIERGPPL